MYPMLAHHEKMRHCLNVILLEIVDSSFDLRYLNDLFLALIDKIFLCFLSQVANVMHLSNRERASLADFLTSASFLPFKINIKSLNQYIHRRTFADHDTAFETYFFPTISLGVKASEPPAHTFRKTHLLAKPLKNDKVNSIIRRIKESIKVEQIILRNKEITSRKCEFLNYETNDTRFGGP